MFFTTCSIQENLLETLSKGFVFNIAIEFNTFLLFLAAVSLALFPNKKLYKDRRNLGTQQKEKKKRPYITCNNIHLMVYEHTKNYIFILENGARLCREQREVIIKPK